MAKKNFTSWLLDLVPPRLKTGEYEIRFVQVVAHLFNAIADGASYAVRCRFIEHMPTDALGYAGADRLLERGPAELDANWRERLLLAWDAWTLAGTVHEDGLLGQIRAFGLDDETTPPLLLESQDVGAPPRSEYWSRFWLVFPPATHGHTVSIPTADLVALRRIVRRFRPAHIVCAGVVFVVTGRLWDWNMPATWDDWAALGEQWDDNVSLSNFTYGF